VHLPSPRPATALGSGQTRSWLSPGPRECSPAARAGSTLRIPGGSSFQPPPLPLACTTERQQPGRTAGALCPFGDGRALSAAKSHHSQAAEQTLTSHRASGVPVCHGRPSWGASRSPTECGSQSSCSPGRRNHPSPPQMPRPGHSPARSAAWLPEGRRCESAAQLLCCLCEHERGRVIAEAGALA